MSGSETKTRLMLVGVTPDISIRMQDARDGEPYGTEPIGNILLPDQGRTVLVQVADSARAMKRAAERLTSFHKAHGHLNLLARREPVTAIKNPAHGLVVLDLPRPQRRLIECHAVGCELGVPGIPFEIRGLGLDRESGEYAAHTIGNSRADAAEAAQEWGAMHQARPVAMSWEEQFRFLVEPDVIVLYLPESRPS